VNKVWVRLVSSSIRKRFLPDLLESAPNGLLSDDRMGGQAALVDDDTDRTHGDMVSGERAVA